ncbi:MAG: hypothetical protein H6635_02900 [Anaerolineales bacterium]|nr:hypothetical protein [Anaerolineales bacterium]MCB9144290.1 hypothetical protein [Anaerolineales bacterium]
MGIDVISWVAVVFVLISAASMLTVRDWRFALGALALQYLAAFWLVSRHLPFAMSSIKLIAGWMTIAILGITRLNQTELDTDADTIHTGGTIFQAILMGIVALSAAGATPLIENAIPGMGLPVIMGGLALIGAGVINLGMTSDILRVTIGLLTMLSGFEIIYAAVESAILVTGLLALVNLGLGILGSYLLLAGYIPLTSPEEEEL